MDYLPDRRKNRGITFIPPYQCKSLSSIVMLKFAIAGKDGVRYNYCSKEKYYFSKATTISYKISISGRCVHSR